MNWLRAMREGIGEKYRDDQARRLGSLLLAAYACGHHNKEFLGAIAQKFCNGDWKYIEAAEQDMSNADD